MNLGLLGQAAGMFAVTNIDDLLVLALFFARAGGDRAAVARVVAGQYLGFGAILLVSVAGALGAGLLPPVAVRCLGLLPLALGLRAGWQAWTSRRAEDAPVVADQGIGMIRVAVVTFANGGDNIGVYVPLFAVIGAGGMAGCAVVFLIGVALWCVIGGFLAGRPVVAGVFARWGHVVLPVVLVGLGVAILAGLR